jgi:branched-chain amino acid transport system substrate-binding protein
MKANPFRSGLASRMAFAAVVMGCAIVSMPAFARQDGVGDKSIMLGTTNPLTGVAASACKPVSDGASAWFAKVNEEGGVNGRTIETSVLDDQYQAPQALANARTFVRDQVFAVFGGCGTIQPAAIYQLLDHAGVPYLFPYASLEELAKPVKKATFALMPINQEQMTGLIRYVVKTDGPGKISGIYTKVPGAEQAAEANGAAAKSVGADWTGYQVITPGSTDFTPIVLRLKQANPTYLVLNMLEPDAGRLFIAMRAQNWFPKRMLGTSAISSGSAFQAVGDILDGKLLAVSPTAPSTSADAASCAEAFAAQSVPVNGFSLFGCGTAQALVHALQQAGPQVTREAVGKVLEGWKGENASPVLPPITFSPTDHMGETKMILIGVKDAKPVAVGTVDLLAGGGL